ncbi:hypothetical protein ACET3Z_027242 [Daucus carota]
MSNAISVGGIILMGIKSASLTSLVSISVLFMILCCLIELYDDFYSSVVQPSLDFLSVSWKCYSAKGTNSKVRKIISSPHSNDDNHDCRDTKWILRAEVEMVMERLGLSSHPNCDKKLQERFSSHEIANMFNVNEPSLGEVQQAFDLFDENSDGYVDQKDPLLRSAPPPTADRCLSAAPPRLQALAPHSAMSHDRKRTKTLFSFLSQKIMLYIGIGL